MKDRERGAEREREIRISSFKKCVKSSSWDFVLISRWRNIRSFKDLALESLSSSITQVMHTNLQGRKLKFIIAHSKISTLLLPLWCSEGDLHLVSINLRLKQVFEAHHECEIRGCLNVHLDKHLKSISISRHTFVRFYLVIGRVNKGLHKICSKSIWICLTSFYFM